MSTVFDITMSLDGYMTAAGQTAEEPMGEGGHRLHAWAFDGDEQDQRVMSQGGAGTGAVICGRRTYDHSVPWWEADGPTGGARLPVFVLSHGRPDAVPEGGVYTFAAGVETALEQARAAAGGKDVTVMGGADTGRQFLAAGLLDELSLHVVPVLLGGGTRMFGDLDAHVELEPVSSIQTPNATHLRLRIRR